MIEDTELVKMSVYFLTVREHLGKELALRGVIGYQEKADRLMVNENFEVLSNWKKGVSPENASQLLVDLLPANWSRKSKKVKATVNQS